MKKFLLLFVILLLMYLCMACNSDIYPENTAIKNSTSNSTTTIENTPRQTDLFKETLPLSTNAEPYEIVTIASNFISSDKVTFERYRNKYVETDIPAKSITIDGKDIEVVYKETVDNTGDITYWYQSSDHSVKCSFRSDGDTLDWIKIENNENVEMIDTCYNTENEYLQRTKEELQKWGVNDLNEYHYSGCSTSYTVMSASSSSGKSADNFYVPANSNEIITAYTFEFVKNIDGYATSDVISVNWLPQKELDTGTGEFVTLYGSVSIGFSENEFEDISVVEGNSIDIDRIKIQVRAFVRNAVLANVSFEFVDNGKFDFIDGRLCYIYQIRLTHTASSGTKAADSAYVGVYINN